MLNSFIGIIASSGGVAVSNSYESIATVTVGGGGSASISFTSIPSTYQHLQVRGISRNTVAGGSVNDQIVRFNSDSSSNYSNHYLYGTGSSAAAAANLSATYAVSVEILQDSTLANTYVATILDILDYADTNKFKTMRTFSAWDTNGTGDIFFNSAGWRSTSAITSIDISSSSGNLKQYTQFALYGIKG